jgi:Glycosyl hydrolase family 26
VPVAVALWLAVGTLLVLLPGAAAPAHAAAQAAAQLELYYGMVYPGAPDISVLQTYEHQIGKGMSLVLWYQSWIEGGSFQGFPADQLTAVRHHGAIPVLAWEPQSYPDPSNQNEPQLSLAKIIGGAWDSQIRSFAQGAKAWGHPFFLRFASEMNGSWTPWSEWSNGNSMGQYAQMWRHVHQIFTAVGATNVTWVWCPNTEDSTTIPLHELYPGNAYVDWVGMDGYNFSSGIPGAPWRTFSQIFRSTYDDLSALSAPNTPIMIGETGSVEQGGSKADWIHDALATQLPANYPRVKALIWFNTTDATINLRIDTSAAALAAFQHAIALPAYQPNRYADLKQAPIPPPEQVVLPPAPPPPTGTAAAAADQPRVDHVLGGPSPGTILIVNAATGAQVVGVTLRYADGTLATTDRSGTSRVPSPKGAPSMVLEQIIIGTTVIAIELAVDAQYGYEVLVDITTGMIAQILVNVVLFLVPIFLQVVLLASLIAILIGKGTRRGRRRRQAQAQSVTQSAPAVRTLADMPQRQR